MAISGVPTDVTEQSAPGSWSLPALLTIGFLGLTAGVQMSDRGMQAILLSAIQATFTVSDGTIGALRRVAGAQSRMTGSLGTFLRQRWQALGLFVGVAGSLMIAVQALNPLIAMALERRFDADLRGIGHALGMVTLITSIGCLPVAGLLDTYLRRRVGLTARPLIMGISAAAAIPCAAALIFVKNVDHALIMVTLFLFLTSTANALVPTMLQDLTPASLRSRSFAIWSFVVSIFCAIGPLIAGPLSDLLMHSQLLVAIAVTAVPALTLSAICAARSAFGLKQVRSDSIA